MNLFRFFLCIIIITAYSSCQNLERNCTDYKTGTFTFNYTIDGQEKTGRFVRTDSLSIDYFDAKVDSSSIRWINDCEFVSKKINPKTMSEKNPLHFKILSTTDSTYTFEYKLVIDKPNTSQRVERGTAYKIK